jgi:hypothetical protein
MAVSEWVCHCVISLLFVVPTNSFVTPNYQWAEFNYIRRQRVGNYACRTLSVCKRFQDSRSDETIEIPAELDGLTIASHRRNELLVHFITNFSVLADFMIKDNVNRGEHSKESFLLKCLLAQGMIEVVYSATFGINDTQEKGRLLRDPRSTIALSHPSVDRLERLTILGMPSYATSALGRRNNEEYREANTPVFFVDDSPEKLKSKRQVHAIVGGSMNTIFQFLEVLKQRFANQGSNEPVEDTKTVGRGRNKTSYTVVYGFYNPHV